VVLLCCAVVRCVCDAIRLDELWCGGVYGAVRCVVL